MARKNRPAGLRLAIVVITLAIVTFAVVLLLRLAAHFPWGGLQ